MFDRDSLWNAIYFVLEKEFSDPVKVDYLTDRICDEVAEWVPKKGDFWLNEAPEGDGRLYMNLGWKDVLAEQFSELKALSALDDLYEKNGEGMKQLADSKWDDPIPDGIDPWNLGGRS